MVHAFTRRPGLMAASTRTIWQRRGPVRRPRHCLIGVAATLGYLFCITSGASAENRITHGPILGRPGATHMSIWARTERSGQIHVKYGTDPGNLEFTSRAADTEILHDNTGVVHLSDLRPRTRYHYRVYVSDGQPSEVGTFRTWPNAQLTRNDQYNPDGLFNFCFEFACGNNQTAPQGATEVRQRTYETLLRDHADRLDFAILNGDWLYEEKRDYPLTAWVEQVGDVDPPAQLARIPTIVGVWENYKLYLSRGRSLSEFHRHVPSFFTIDDHETLNDVAGSGRTGFKNRKAVFRDIGVQAWLDYLAWSNPADNVATIHFGDARLTAGSAELVDSKAEFTKLPLDKMANLHIHWGGDLAGEKLAVRDEYPGDPNGGVYEIVDVVDDHTLKISPPATADGSAVYSIGRRLYGQFRVSNCHFFLLDTRSHRDVPDFARPERSDRSMLGSKQLAWLKSGIAASDADFIFVVSSVNFMIPHSAPNQQPGEIPNKGEAWTVFLHEREELLELWDGMDKPVFLLTGDLHNSFAIQITDNVWEFASGPHESANHHIGSEGNRPLNGPFQHGPRPFDILWSSYLLPDTPRSLSRQPHFCVIQVNNVTNNPQRPGEDRWIAFPRPQVVFQYYDGLTGDLKFAHTIPAIR